MQKPLFCYSDLEHKSVYIGKCIDGMKGECLCFRKKTDVYCIDILIFISSGMTNQFLLKPQVANAKLRTN